MFDELEMSLNNGSLKRLTMEQEFHLFRLLNEAKEKGNKEREKTIKGWLVEINKDLVYKMKARYHKFKSIDNDDIVSEGFYYLFNAINNFDYTKGIRFSTYACWAIGRGIIARQRKYLKRKEVQEPEDFILEDLIPANDTNSENNETINRIKQSVDSLKLKDRMIIRELYFENKTLQEVATLFGVSKQAIEQRRNRILRDLKDMLD